MMNSIKDNLSTLTVYSGRPWLLEGTPEGLAPLFRGAPVETYPAGDEFFFGAEPALRLIEEGLVGTYASVPGLPEQMTVLFGQGSVLGAFKALTHEARSTPLISRVLLPIRVRRVSEKAFLSFLDADAARSARVFRSLLVQHEQAMEGMLLNDLLPVEARLARMIDTLFRAAGTALSEEPVVLPVPVTVQELAGMVHADRAFVSRILSGWRAKGCFERNGRRLSFSSGIFETKDF